MFADAESVEVLDFLCLHLTLVQKLIRLVHDITESFIHDLGTINYQFRLIFCLLNFSSKCIILTFQSNPANFGLDRKCHWIDTFGMDSPFILTLCNPCWL